MRGGTPTFFDTKANKNFSSSCKVFKFDNPFLPTQPSNCFFIVERLEFEDVVQKIC